MKAKILITLKSFERIQTQFILRRFSYFDPVPRGPNASRVQLRAESPSAFHKRLKIPISSIALPKKQTIFTVLRSPHIDKKSRDQFEYKIYKQLVSFETEINLIREKLYNLKFHEIPGVQMKVVLQTKTRLRLNEA